MSLKIPFKFVKKSDNLQLNGSYFLSKGEPQMRGRAFLNATTELLGHSVPPTQNTRRRFSAEGTKDFFSDDSNKHTNLLILLDIRIKYYQYPLFSLWKYKRKWNGRMCYMLKIRGGGHEKVPTKQRVNLITHTDIVTSQVFVGTLVLKSM